MTTSSEPPTGARRGFLVGVFFLGGLAMGVAYILLTGILTIQTAGVSGGAVINLSNEIIAVKSPSTPLLPWLANAILGALALCVVVVAPRRRSTVVQVAVSAGFLVSTLTLFVWSLSIARRAVLGTESALPPLGWEGWLREAGTNPAVHLVMVLTVGALVVQVQRCVAKRT